MQKCEIKKQFVAQEFTSLFEPGFNAQKYSALKFGSNRVAREFGHEMAEKFYRLHKNILITDRCVVIPSAFNGVEIAATILAKHFMNKLNDLLCREGYQHVEWTIMHRTMSYIADYSFLNAEERKKLLEDDTLFINKDFIRGKVLLFVDDVTITGTHERKIETFLRNKKLSNPHLFCYYARYLGEQAQIEAALNGSGVQTPEDFIKIVGENDYQIVVRALRFLLEQDNTKLLQIARGVGKEMLEKMYYACLAKGYDKTYPVQVNEIRAFLIVVGCLARH